MSMAQRKTSGPKKQPPARSAESVKRSSKSERVKRPKLPRTEPKPSKPKQQPPVRRAEREQRPSGGERVKRPELPRTEPIRSWSTLFGSDSAVGRARDTYAVGAQAASSAVQRGVEVGYRVVDEYVRQGSAAAAAFSAPNRAQASNGAQGLPNGDLPLMAERMLRNAQDFSSMWFEMMGSMLNMSGQFPGAAARGASSSNGHAPPPPASRGAAGEPPADAVRSRLIVRIDSVRPTEVTLTLDDHAHGDEIAVEPLRAATGSSSIDDVSLTLSESPRGTLTLKARVPAEIPADRYSGALLDAIGGKPRGRLTIAVSS
jgi:hypothetical protein